VVSGGSAETAYGQTGSSTSPRYAVVDNGPLPENRTEAAPRHPGVGSVAVSSAARAISL
jgi:hypothetical protein